MKPRSVSFVAPAFNEEAGIAETLQSFDRCADRLVATRRATWVEFVIVDDGSTDGTAGVLTELMRVHPRLVVRRHDRNRGRGAALRTGFASASGELVFYTDADLPVDLRAVDRAIDMLDEHVDVVSVYRSRRTGEGPRRFTYSLAYNQICRVVLGLRVNDVNFAAKLVRTERLRHLDLRSEGSFIDAELLARLQRGGATVVQFAAEYHPRSKGVSTLSSTEVIIQMVREMWQLTPSIRRTQPIAAIAP